MSAQPQVSLVDSFELSRGIEAQHCFDGTHYDTSVLAAEAALLLRVVALIQLM